MKTIGIKLADGSFYPVLQEGSSNEKILNLTTANNNQTKVMVDMYRSERKTMDDAEYVDSLQIDNLIAHPNGEPNITFTVSLDDDQNLNAKIVDTETGAQSNSTITLVTRSSEERLVTDEYNIEESKAVAAMATGIGLLAAAEAIRSKQKDLEDPISEQDFSLGDISDESLPAMEDFSLEEEVPVDENFSQGDEPSPPTDDIPVEENFSDLNIDLPSDDSSTLPDMDLDFPTDDTPAGDENASPEATDDLSDLDLDLPTDDTFTADDASSLDLDDNPPADDASSLDLDDNPPADDTTSLATDDLSDLDLDLPTDDNLATADVSSLSDEPSPSADDIPIEENFSDLNIDLPSDDSSTLPDMDLDFPTDATPADVNTITEDDLNIDDFNIDDLDLPKENSNIDFDNLDKEPQEELPPPYIDDSQYHDDYERPGSKFKIPVIICIACAAICLIILLIMLLLVPSKKKNKKNKEQQTEIVQTETTQKTEPVIEEAPPAKEDEVIIIEKAETVVPVEPKPAKKSNNINYKIKWGDTLWDIADTYYKNPWRYKYLARYNGIKNPDYIISGTYIIIPAE